MTIIVDKMFGDEFAQYEKHDILAVRKAKNTIETLSNEQTPQRMNRFKEEKMQTPV